MSISRERVNIIALAASDAITKFCGDEKLDLPADFENKFHEDLEDLLAEAYGDPDYQNYN